MTAEPVRQPAVAGRFYEADANSLRREIESCYVDARGPGGLPQVNPDGPRKIVGLVSPHAGYMFSGAVAAHAFSRLAADGAPEVAIVISPTHGNPMPAIQTRGSWRTPLGDMPIHEEVASAIAAKLPDFRDGPEGFVGEHTLEVQLPFLQHLYGDACRLVPIMVVRQDSTEAHEVAQAIVSAVGSEDAVIIASTDMTHHRPAEVTIAQDKILIPLMESMDAEGILHTRPDITMCGRGPVAAMLIAACELGATRAQMVHYGHSGEVMASAGVVGYVSIVVSQ